jgi:hypothetical protein
VRCVELGQDGVEGVEPCVDDRRLEGVEVGLRRDQARGRAKALDDIRINESSVPPSKPRAVTNGTS